MSDTLQIVEYFTNICLEKNLDKITEFCKNENYINIIKKQFENEIIYRENCILNNAFKNILELEENKQFIKNLISDEIFIKNNLSIFFMEQLIKAVNKNEINNLINFFINDEKINKIIKNSIIFDKDNDKIIFDNILIYTSINNNNFNCEFFITKMLENDDILKTLFNYYNNEFIIGYIFHNSSINLNNGGIPNINIIEKMLESRDIVRKICNEFSFGQFFMNISYYNFKNAFDIFFDKEIVPKISKDFVGRCFDNCIKNERIDILEKLFDTELVNKIDDFYILDAITYLCENKKTKFINLLINNNTILNKITNYPDKLTECFKFACDNKNEDIVRLILSEREIEEKIGKDKIKKGIEKISFLKSCDADDVSVAEEFIVSKPDILTEEVINKLNNNKILLLYNILNKDDFDEKDIKVVKILIAKGVKINKTSKLVRKNINKTVESLNKEGYKIKKQHFGIINNKKFKKTEEAIEKIKTFINIKKSTNDISVNSTSINIVLN